MTDYEEDLDVVLVNAFRIGVSRIVTIGVDVQSSLKALGLAKRYDGIYCSIGCHPHHAQDLASDSLPRLCELIREKEVVAWGEIGLDYYRRYSPPQKQVEVFVDQLELAAEYGLPVIIHCREASTDLFEILKKKGNNQRGVLHCFSGDYDLAMKFIELGYLISIAGTVTYTNAAGIRDVARRAPLEYLLLETDSPFLSPAPKRGKRNEPQFLIHTARKVAEIREMDLRELARQTTRNATELFDLPEHQ